MCCVCVHVCVVCVNLYIICCVCLSVGCVVENKIILQSGEISATSIIILIHIIRGKPRSQIDASTRDIYASHRVAMDLFV